MADIFCWYSAFVCAKSLAAWSHAWLAFSRLTGFPLLSLNWNSTHLAGGRMSAAAPASVFAVPMSMS